MFQNASKVSGSVTSAITRTSIVAFRMMFGVSGWIILALGFAVFFAATDAYPNGQMNPANYPPFVQLLSVGIFSSTIVTSWGTRSIVPFLPRQTQSNGATVTRIFHDLVGSRGRRARISAPRRTSRQKR